MPGRLKPHQVAQIAGYIQAGWTNSQIAEAVGCLPDTVARHRAKVPTVPIVPDVPDTDSELPVRNWRDKKDKEIAEKLRMEREQEESKLVRRTALVQMLSGLNEKLRESYGESFWRWCEDRGLDYDEIRRYCVAQEASYVGFVNDWVEKGSRE